MKIFIKILISGVFIAHLSLTFLYLLPQNPATNYYQKITQKYMNTFFTQDWKLFSPEPALYSIKMFYSCNLNNSRLVKWKNPLKNLIKEHQQNRFLFKGKMLYVYHGLYSQLLNKRAEIAESEKCDLKTKNCYANVEGKLRSSQAYLNIDKFVKAMCLSEGKNANQRFKIFKSYPIPFSKRNEPDAQPVVSLEYDSGVQNGFK
jgi:hypothetical protein